MTEKDKKGTERDKGWACDLVPKDLIVARYLAKEQAEPEALEAELEGITTQRVELEEEHGGEDGVFGELEKIIAGSVNARLKEIKKDRGATEEEKILKAWVELSSREAGKKKGTKKAEREIEGQAVAVYSKRGQAEVKDLVVEQKWLGFLADAIFAEMGRVSHVLTQRLSEIGERYDRPMSSINADIVALEKMVGAHLGRMGFKWA